jgi:hypothetical protein
MRVSYLGGETGHRGLLGMGNAASRGRVTALSVAAVAAGIATIYLGVAGLAVGLIAAAVVLLATARTPAGSVWTRAQARRRWRERTRSGTVAFRPVAARPSGPLPGVPETVWRAAPDGLEGMSWLQTTPGRPGIAWHAPTGEDPYLSVAYAVDGQLQGLAGDHTVDQAAQAFGELLARYGSPLSLPSRLQTVTRVVPVDSARHEEWVLDQLDPAAPEALLASYDDVVRELGRGGLVQRHYVVVRWPLTSQFTAAAARYGDGLEGWIALMEQQTGAVARHLSAARFRGVRPLSAAQLAAVLRHLQHPDWPIDQAGDVSLEPWMASQDSWSATTVRDLDPNGVVQEWWHRTAVIPVETLQTGPRTSLWLAPVLGRLPVPVIRTVSLQVDVIPAPEARRAARVDVTADMAAIIDRQAGGGLTDEETAVAMEAARTRLADLSPGSGHHGAAWCGHVTVSARTREDLAMACLRVAEAASASGIEALRWLDTQQAAGLASTMPVARGMKQSQSSASSRLLQVLAGTGSREALT